MSSRTNQMASGVHSPPQPLQGGAPFFNLTRATYLDIQPRAAGVAAAPSRGSPWAYVLVAAAVIAAAAVVIFVLRRPRAGEGA